MSLGAQQSHYATAPSRDNYSGVTCPVGHSTPADNLLRDRTTTYTRIGCHIREGGQGILSTTIISNVRPRIYMA